MSDLVSLFTSHVWTVGLFLKKIKKPWSFCTLFCSLNLCGEWLVQCSGFFHSNSLPEGAPVKSDLGSSDWAPGLKIPQLQWNRTDVAQLSGRIWVQGAECPELAPGWVGAWIDAWPRVMDAPRVRICDSWRVKSAVSSSVLINWNNDSAALYPSSFSSLEDFRFYLKTVAPLDVKINVYEAVINPG